mgnify:CR=1 FL=1
MTHSITTPASHTKPFSEQASLQATSRLSKDDIQKNTIKEAVPVYDFRNAIDSLFDQVNVHYHACVGSGEIADFLARLKRNHTRLLGLTCKRAKPYDFEQYERALAAAEACYPKAEARLAQAKAKEAAANNVSYLMPVHTM